MKRMLMVVVVVLVTSASNAIEGNQLIRKDNFQHQYNKLQFLDSAGDEYAQNEGDQQDIDEYDQHVCDDAHSPKISSIEAFFREVAGFVFVRYIILREMVSAYSHEIKEVISKWFNMLVKA